MAAAKRRRPPDPARSWARRLGRSRPGLVDDTLVALREMYGRPSWRRVHDPTSELVLTILSQNSADVNAERAFEALCGRWPAGSQGRQPPPEPAPEPPQPPPEPAPNRAAEPPDRRNRPGWGGRGIGPATPDWAAVEHAPLDELIGTIRPGGLAPQKAPRIQASLRRIREQRGDYSLEFLGELPPEDALAWLMGIPGIGRKTASVVLLFSFGMPLMPVDRHVERVAKRIGLVPAKATALQAHDYFPQLLLPEQVHEAHVNLITHGRRTCHALRPACNRCAIAARCRYFNPRAL